MKLGKSVFLAIAPIGIADGTPAEIKEKSGAGDIETAFLQIVEAAA
jgi:hypothetical protein